MRWTEIVSILCGLAVGTFGWIIIAGAIITLNDGEVTGGLAGHLSLMVLLGVVPVAVGGLLVWTPFRRRGRRRKEGLERSILELAVASGGTLTPAQVARGTELTLDEAKLMLDEMVIGGFCVSELQDGGQVVYRFSDGG